MRLAAILSVNCHTERSLEPAATGAALCVDANQRLAQSATTVRTNASEALWS